MAERTDECPHSCSTSSKTRTPKRLLRRSGTVIQERSSARLLCRGGCGSRRLRCITPGICRSFGPRQGRCGSRGGGWARLVTRLVGAVILDRQPENHDDGDDNDDHPGPHCAGTTSRLEVEGARWLHIGWPTRIGVAWVGMSRVRHGSSSMIKFHDQILGGQPLIADNVPCPYGRFRVITNARIAVQTCRCSMVLWVAGVLAP